MQVFRFDANALSERGLKMSPPVGNGSGNNTTLANQLEYGVTIPPGVVAPALYKSVDLVVEQADSIEPNHDAKILMVSLWGDTQLLTVQNLSEPVHLTIQVEQALRSGGHWQCVYWDNTTWASDGCEAIRVDDTGVVCAVSHFTSFTVQFVDGTASPTIMNARRTRNIILSGQACWASLNVLTRSTMLFAFLWGALAA
jgi:hypothetical protein